MTVFVPNDNLKSREHLYRNTYDEAFLKFIPLARYIISKYINEYWKHDIEDNDYIKKEWWLTYGLYMEEKRPSRKGIEMFANYLQVPQALLYNDTNLPFLAWLKKSDLENYGPNAIPSDKKF